VSAEPIFLLLALPVAMVLAALALQVDRWRSAAPRLAQPDLWRQAPGVTVLLPARNEEENVEACVRSLLAQQGLRPEGLRVLVIDDSSEDRTAEIVRCLAAEDPRVELVAAPPLPPGWKGKVHALATGLPRVETPWLLSTDADTRHHPDLLARALSTVGSTAEATVQRGRLDSLSVAGWQEARGPGENLVTPVVFACLDFLLGDWHPAAEGATEVANGQFFLMRTEVLRRAGGFAALRDAALDDVALARTLRAAGARHAFVRAPGLLRVRMYRGLGGTFRGWRRNLGAVFAGRRRVVAAVLAVLLAPALLLLGALLFWAMGAGAWPAAALLWAGGAAASVIARRGSRHAPAYGLLYPLDALLTSLCLVLGLRDAARGSLAAWKGRAVKLQ
jgi:cellulose synthase/poly-beta-1,6-N-acetylglucosamine synthase-like glycosyltransferase